MKKLTNLCYHAFLCLKKLKSDDRLNELPDSLILHILSFLDTREVVRTTLLSKRWKDFWVTISRLQFNVHGGDSVKIRNFVNQTLKHWRGTHLREFSIRISGYSGPEASLYMDMTQWVHFATERKVEMLCINYNFGSTSTFYLPNCLYECSSIRKLSLYGCYLRNFTNVRWDRLDTLALFGCVFGEDVIDQDFSSNSPRLETFTAHYNLPFQNWTIRSSSLKNLAIECVKCYPSVLKIWAPNLEVLKYSGKPYIKCLLEDVSSLSEMHLDFSSGSVTPVEEALRQILPALQHVVTVQLSASCFQVLKAIQENYYFSPLSNVKLLTIDSYFIKLRDIVGLCECFPKMEKLNIVSFIPVNVQFKFDVENYTESEANILRSNLLQLQTVVIATQYVYEASFFEFAEFMLKHATVLEKMVIRKKGVFSSDQMFQTTKQLLSLQRSFPSVELIML